MKNIKIDRPKLKDVSPFLHAVIIMFIWLNPLVAWSLIAQAPNAGLVVVGSYFLTYLWAALFCSLSVVLLYGLIRNNWDLTQKALIVGLFAKSFFTYSLIVLAFHVGINQIIGVLGIWIALTWVQFFAVRFSIPMGERNVK